MAVQFAVLASGSRGNATLIRSETGGAGLLIDVGIGPRTLSQRLEAVGAGWQHVGAAVLTHTHGDHIDDATMHDLARRGVPLYVHEGHVAELRRHAGFVALETARLARRYDERPFLSPTGQGVEPVELRHDGGPTFGFRIDARDGRAGRPVAIGYVADTGSWSHAMADLLAEVDLLGMEFNHDVELQRTSNRHPALIARVLGDRGHLSNAQAADFVAAVLDRSGQGAVRHLVLLHLSQQCNLPTLALKSARAAAREAGRRVTVHAALQSPAHPSLWLRPSRQRIRAMT